MRLGLGELRATYTSRGVAAPWVTAQQTAPAKANREYRLTGLSGVASLGAVGTPIMIDLRAEVVGRVKLSDNLRDL